MDNPVSKVASALGSAGSKLVQPQSDEAAGIAAKNQMIDEYKNATMSPASTPKASGTPGMSTSPFKMDKVNPSARYGSRKGEKRIDTKTMTKPLGVPSYEDGVDSVPNDGLAMLHEGEKVVPANKNPDSHKAETRVKGAMGSGSTKKLAAHKGTKKTVHSITVHKSKSGGVILEHHINADKKEMQHHPDFDSAAKHMKKHFQDEASGSDAGQSEGNEGPSMATPPSAPQSSPNPQENLPNPSMASPSSFEDGGVVKKSGQAQVHKGEVVVPKSQAHKVLQNPDITIGGGSVGTEQVTPEMKQQMDQSDRGSFITNQRKADRNPSQI